MDEPLHVRFLYAHNRWANHLTLEAAGALAAPQLHQDLGSSHRSIFGTLSHMLWADWLWLGRWQRLPAPSGTDPRTCNELPDLRARWEQVEHDRQGFLLGLTADALDTLLTYDNPPGTPWTYSLRHMLTQVLTHSAYHRGQVASMIRQIGGTPPATDFLVFLDVLGPNLRPGV